MKKAIKWIIKHVRFRSRDLNAVQPSEHFEERKPVKAHEICIKWEF